MNAVVWITRRLRGKPAASATKPVNRSPQGRTSNLPFFRPKTPAGQNAMKTFHSPLSIDRPLKTAEVDAVDIVFSDWAVLRAADRLTSKRMRLMEVAGLRSAISEAIAHAVGDGAPLEDMSPAGIVAVLDRLATQVDADELAVREDHTRHNARRQARLNRLAPLRCAVIARSNQLVDERTHLIKLIDAARNAATLGYAIADMRFSNLLAVGLTREDIAALRPEASDPDAKIAAYLARIAEVNELLPPLHAFLDDGRGDVAVLAGFGEFDDLVKARLAAEQEPA